MSESLKDYLEAKAHFIGGRRPRFRDAPDDGAISAARDAEQFLTSLPAHLEKPVIKAGTTSDPTTYLTATWLVMGYPVIKAVSLDFKGNSSYDARWDEPTGGRGGQKVAGHQDLARLNLPEKIDNLIAGATLPCAHQQQRPRPKNLG